MAAFKGGSSYKGEDPAKIAQEYHKYNFHHRVTEVGHLFDPIDAHHSVHRGLSARQISMIAIGGALGIGFITGTGSALANAGPASVPISYAPIGILVCVVMCALGKKAAWLPAAGGFALLRGSWIRLWGSRWGIHIDSRIITRCRIS